MTAVAGYDRELEWNERPSAAERRYAGSSVVRAAGAPAASWSLLARVGDVELYLAPPGTAGDAGVQYAEPVLAAKRGRRGGSDYVGVDGRIRLPFAEEGGDGPALPPPVPYPSPPWSSAVVRTSGLPAVRVAIVDVAFDNHGVLTDLVADGGAIDGPYLVGLPSDESARSSGGGPAPARARAAGHGTCMAGVLLAEAPGARVGLFRIPSAAGAARPYLAATDLAAAIAAAVDGWRADLVLVAMSDGAWGTPRHLRDVLRAAGRAGRGGRGVPIFCSVGDPSRNHARAFDSASLGADDLASQPWVIAVAACDREGRWYRVYPGYGRGWGATYNRFGPAVALAAPGEPRRHGGRVAADDSSQAAALVAAAAARVLAENAELSAAELRTLLALTAHVPMVVDGGRGLAAEVADARDRLGHNLKLGYGVVDAGAACAAAADPVSLALLATRPVPDGGLPPEHGAPSPILATAEAFRTAVRVAGGGGERGWAAGYARAGGRVSRLYISSPPVQEALSWLGRHLHALREAAVATAGEGAPSWWSTPQDHGALVERIRHAAETIRDALEPGEPAEIWAREVEQTLARIADGSGDGAARAGAALHAFLASAFAPVMRGAESVSRLPDHGRHGGQS